MKKGLFILNTDNVNQSLINLYLFMCEKQYDLYCFALRNDDLSLHAFEKQNLKLLKIDEICSLNRFDFIVCGRNCFGAFSPNELIDYNGIIYTDDTAFYEGRAVFGDVVFVNGLFNELNIKKISNFEVFAVGCLKGLINYRKKSELWSKVHRYHTKVLYIESGHYPFGQEGRLALAHAFAQIVIENPECEFIVKPRFLIGEASTANHGNTDYLFYYVKSFFNDEWPENLTWLDEYYSLDILISEADVVIHTYSSAHSQAALQGKRIINLIDIPSFETADFRTNRFNQIKNVIDLAGNNISITELKDCIVNSHKASDEYVTNLGAYYREPQRLIENYINSGTTKRLSDRRAKRMRGYFYYVISVCENRFDEYEYFLKKMDHDLKLIKIEEFDTKEFIMFVNDKVNEYQLEYIRENWENICSNKFDRAYALRVLYETDNIRLLKRMIDDAYVVYPIDSSYYYYLSVYHKKVNELIEAKHYALEYIEHIKYLKYETLDSERNTNITKMKEVILL